MTMQIPAEGPFYRADGSFLGYVDVAATLKVDLVSTQEDGPALPQDLTGRVFLQRILDGEGAILLEVYGVNAVDGLAHRVAFPLTQADTRTLLPTGGVAARDLTHVVGEVTVGGFDQLYSASWSLRRLRRGMPATVMQMEPNAGVVLVRYAGAPPLSLLEELIASGDLAEDATHDDLVDWLQDPANDAAQAALTAIAAAATAVVGVGGTIDDREDVALAAIAEREQDAIETGGAIDVREDAALAAVAGREQAAIGTGGAIDVREDAALEAIDDKVEDIVTGGGELEAAIQAAIDAASEEGGPIGDALVAVLVAIAAAGNGFIDPTTGTLTLASEAVLNAIAAASAAILDPTTGALPTSVAAALAALVAARDAALAAMAAAPSGTQYLTGADGISNGVWSLTSVVNGSGGTNGPSFPLAFSGGGGSGAAGWFSVAGGALSGWGITARGRGYTTGSPPAVSFAASAGLTATATAVISPNETAAAAYMVQGSGSKAAMTFVNGVEQRAWPSFAYVTQFAGLPTFLSTLIVSQVIGNAGTPITGSNVGAQTYAFAQPIDRTGGLASLTFFALATGTFKVRRMTKAGNVFTQVGSDLVITVATSGVAQTQTPLDFGDWPVVKGEFLAFYGSGIIPYTVATGAAFYAASGDQTTFTDASSATNNKIQLSFTVKGSGVGEAPVAEVVLQRLGRQDVCSDGTVPVDRTLVIAEPAVQACEIGRVRLFAEVAGLVRFGAWSKTGNDFLELRSASIWVPAGLSEWSATEGDFARVAVNAGELIGYYSKSIVSVTVATADSGGWYAIDGDFTAFTDATVANTARLEISFDLIQVPDVNQDKVRQLADQVRLLRYPAHLTASPKHWLLCTVMGAQSNAQGLGEINSEPPPVGTAIMWNTSGSGAWTALPDGSGGAWQNMTDPTGNNTSNGGSAWCETARRVHELTGGTVGLALINLGVSSTSLTIDWASGGTLRAKALLHIAAAEAAMDADGRSWQRGPVLSIIGEKDSDAITAGTKTIADVETALGDFMTWVRSNLGATMRMVMAVVGTKTSEGAGWTTMRNAQRHWGAKYAGVIVAHTAAKEFAGRGLMGADGIHWKTAALQEVGYDFGTAIVHRALGGG